MAKKSYKDVENEIIDYLEKQGEIIIKNAYNRRRWRNRSYNLQDSYGSAVFRNGVLLRRTIKYISETPQADARRNDKELGDYHGQRSRAQKGSSYKEFGKTTTYKRFLDGDTLYAYGRDEVNKFFQSYKLATPNGLELVVVAAMYYAGILESRQYQVISSATTELNNIANLLGKGVEIFALDVERNRDEAFAKKAFDIGSKRKIN